VKFPLVKGVRDGREATSESRKAVIRYTNDLIRIINLLGKNRIIRSEKIPSRRVNKSETPTLKNRMIRYKFPIFNKLRWVLKNGWSPVRNK
jgi:hypothetical protein